MSHCRGLSIGQWSPIYNVLFQLLLARLLIVKIRILLDCANIFNKNFHILCLFIFILNKMTPLLTELNGMKRRPVKDYSAK